jgi:hypothetical protein
MSGAVGAAFSAACTQPMPLLIASSEAAGSNGHGESSFAGRVRSRAVEQSWLEVGSRAQAGAR